VSELVDRANEILREKGYKEAQLAAFTTPMPGKALLKGVKIVSPFADAPETVLRAVEECVPTLEELGRRVIRPQELRAGLAQQ
jgi:hypothetical protein